MRGLAASPRAVVLTAIALTLALAVSAADAAAAKTGRLVFTARFDDSGGPYAPGSVPFVTVRNAAGTVVAERRAGARRKSLSLRRGSYRVTAYWRPCQGRCDPEDLPLDQCSRRISIHTARRGASETVEANAVFKRGDPCSLGVSSDRPPPAVIRAGKATLLAERGPYCRPSCEPPPSKPSTKRRLPVRAGTLVRMDLQVPTRRLELSGICGHGALHNGRSGRLWSFRVPPETASSIRTCHDIKLVVTYAGRGPLRGVRAVWGFDLRLAG